MAIETKEFPNLSKDKGIFDDVRSFYSVQERLDTFKHSHWPFERGPCTPLKMAEAGFYYIGTESSPDAVRCVVCLTELEGWEEGDEPYKEHKSHSTSSSCPFLHVKDPYLITVGEVFKLEKKSLEYAINKAVKQLGDHYQKIEDYCQGQFDKLKELDS
uniref:Baculoviral IAP repeat-containing protein 5-like protein n=1 Tax=Halisarca dujardinii TaxID=2583056 RepID=A0A6C0PMY6_HALDU|nr:baculoviral IAP repeat-containing protein 5-like protein [Halisarca dujardinii]QIZ30877.1 baculoviral IAP repeat-containing protein 5-like protein [Halisarca dujardinii]